MLVPGDTAAAPAIAAVPAHALFVWVGPALALVQYALAPLPLHGD